MFQNNEILRYSAAKASKLARRNIKKSQRQQSLIECSIFKKEDKEGLAIWDGTDLSLGLCATCCAPYSIVKEGALQSEMALTCLWGYVAHGSVPRGKPHIQDVPQQLRDEVQCDRHNHTASCPSQTGGACKETSGLHTLLVTFVPKYSPLFYITISVFSSFIK